MDLDTLLIIVLLLAPVLSRLFRGNKTRGTAQPPRQVPRPTPGNDRQLTPFEDALRQIQEALAERTAEQQRPEPPPPPPRPKLPRRPPVVEQQEFHSKEKVEKERFFDDAFEASARLKAPGGDEHYHEPLGAELPKPDLQRPKVRRKGSARWRRAMRDVVILNQPRSRSRWTPPGV